MFQRGGEINEVGLGLLSLRGLKNIQLGLPIRLWVMAGIQERGWR